MFRKSQDGICLQGKGLKIQGNGVSLDEYGIPKPNLPVGGIKDYIAHLPNEKNFHAPMANYCGPRTAYAERIMQGIKPTTKTDAGCMRHDYAFARIGKRLQEGIITNRQAKEETRKADETLKATAENSMGTFNPIENIHAKATLIGMNTKMGSEDLHLMDPLKFIKGEGIQGGKKKRRRRKKDPIKKLRKQMKPIERIS